MISQRQAMLVLNGLPHVGPVMLQRLMDAFGNDAVAVLSGQSERLLSVKGVGKKAVEVLANWQKHFDLEKEEASMRKFYTRYFARADEEYPRALRELYDSPIGLYWKGEYVVDQPCIAIVGTRRATLYGRSVAKRFASELARMGFCIVSGMARGTDTAAHEGALEVGGKTVAVLGCGLDIIYPPENLDLYKQIAQEGAVVSEFPFGRRADRQTFPMRNRVVSGMSEGVIVIESDAAGGSMITARFAGEQGRSLFAVPGRIDQASSVGCHQLLRDGATLLTSVDDILEELRYAKPKELELNFGEFESPSAINLSELEQAALDCFEGGELLAPDAISERLSRSAAEVSAILMGLELKRLVVKRGDGRFEAK
ncbi:MAG: DNA-processing protein DprA [Lentimonas sp.]